jgi:hypothetical protein
VQERERAPFGMVLRRRPDRFAQRLAAKDALASPGVTFGFFLFVSLRPDDQDLGSGDSEQVLVVFECEE